MRKITTHYIKLTSKSFSLYDLTRLHLNFSDMASRWVGAEVGNNVGESAFSKPRSSQNHLKVVTICQCQKTASGFGYMTWGCISESNRKRWTETREVVEYKEHPSSFQKTFKLPYSFQNNGKSFFQNKDRSEKLSML